jgi:hypothetical protein
VSFANGKYLAVDPGTQAYAAPTHATWDKTTVAHNTMVVDEQTQAQSTGRLIDWRPGPDATMIRVSAGPVYPAIEMERTIVLTADYALDIATVKSSDDKDHRFDWLYHNFGAVDIPLHLEPYASLPKTNGYQHLTGARAAATAEDWQAAFVRQGSNLWVTMLGAPETTVVTGQGLGPDLRVPVPFVMARRRGREARFVTVYEPYREQPQLEHLRCGENTCTVELAGATDEITLPPAGFARKRILKTSRAVAR